MNGNVNQLRRRIMEVLSEVFGLPLDVVKRGITPDTVIGWDSERHVELVVALEEHFGCMFEVEEIPELISLEQIEEIVTRHGAPSDN